MAQARCDEQRDQDQAQLQALTTESTQQKNKLPTHATQLTPRHVYLPQVRMSLETSRNPKLSIAFPLLAK